MNRTITALFDSRDDAERAQSRLRDTGVASVNITTQDSGAEQASGAASGTPTPLSAEPVRDVTEGDYGDGDSARRGGGGGLWASIKNLFSDDDRPTYEEGLRRGHFLLTAQVDDDRADEAVRILEDSDAVDVDRRVEEWRSAGWTGGASRSADDKLQGIVGDDTLHGTHGDDVAEGRTSLSADDQLQGAAGDDTLRGTQGDDLMRDYGADQISAGERTSLTDDQLQADSAEQAIPIVQEQLRVGKREVGRGGVRVRSYVVEQPVTEQVSLREEHVNVERRPVEQSAATAQGDIFQDRTIELSETAEEVVVSKEARVTEELVINKDVDQRTETVSDTVRHTKVDVERLSGETDDAYRARTAQGGPGTASTV